MKYLGQLVVCPEEDDLKEKICIFLGYTNERKTVANIFGIGKDGYINLETYKDLHFLRVDDKYSPTGNSVYFGPFVKKTLFNHFKIKPPPGDAFEKELKKIKKLNGKI